MVTRRLPPLGNRRGKGHYGCLLTLLLMAVGGYYGVQAGTVWLRYYQMKDEMQVQANFAPNLEDAAIRRRLKGKAEELGLPADAQRINIRRRSRPREIIISTTWQDTLDFRPFPVKVITLQPEVKARL
jgi:hypothetical protein